MMKKTILIVFIIIGAFNFIPEQNKVFANVQSDEIKRLELQEEPPAPVIIIIRPKVEYSAPLDKDPFIIKQAKDETAEKPSEVEIEITLPDLKIQGIVWGGENPQAIINQKVCNIGSVIDDVHIVDINKNGVDIFFRGRKFSIPAPAAAYATEVKDIPKGGTND